MAAKKIVLRDQAQETQLFNNRLLIAWGLMVLALIAIVIRLMFLQVIDHERYTTLSENNRLKILPLPPARGYIFDRQGALLAENKTTYSLDIIPEQVGHIDNLIQELRQIIELNENDISNFKKQLNQRYRYSAVALRANLNEDEVARFSVQRHRFPGVDITSSLDRIYPLKSIGAHAIGYVGRINDQELENIDEASYRGTNYIGKTGLEKYYEEELHGTVGFQRVETNVEGRILRVFDRTPPVPGKSLTLNLDIGLQEYTERLISGERAAVVVIDPNNGGILALVSMPSYDPNLFVNGISPKDYRELRDSPNRPLFNRAIRGQYPPGSTIKPFVGLAGLEYGIRNENSHTWCPGFFVVKGQTHRYRCWRKGGHGSVNLYHAIEQSCDVYFYALSLDLGIDRLYTFMTRFGFGKETGIDVSGELSGLMPSKEWKEKKMPGKPWYGGESVITGIGQGYMLATPVQLATAVAALSMRGHLRQPRVVLSIDEPNRNEGGSTVLGNTVPSPQQATIAVRQPHFWDVAIGGMEAVVHGGRGTAAKVGRTSQYRFAGKTGTAQVVGIKQGEKYNARRLSKKFHDHALFVAFAPLDKPQIAVAVVVENGGGGSQMAAPIAKKVMDYYLLGKSEPKTRVAEQRGR